MATEEIGERTDRRGAPRGERPVDPETGRKVMGNLPFEPTDAQRADVELYAKVMSQAMIAEALGISVDTLTRHFRKELDRGKREAVSAVGAKLLAKAMAGSIPCMIFYLRTQGKWSTRLELTGPEGGPIEKIDLSRLTPEQLEEYGRLAASAAGLNPDGRTDGQSGVEPEG